MLCYSSISSQLTAHLQPGMWLPMSPHDKILGLFLFPIYSKYHKSINNQFVSLFNLSTYLSIIGRYLNSFDSILTKDFNYLLLKFSTTINSYSSKKSILVYNILLDEISNYLCSYSTERLGFRLPRKLVSINN